MNFLLCDSRVCGAKIHTTGVTQTKWQLWDINQATTEGALHGNVRGGCVHEFLDLVAEVIAVRVVLCHPASNKKTAWATSPWGACEEPRSVTHNTEWRVNVSSETPLNKVSENMTRWVSANIFTVIVKSQTSQTNN